ncbi:MAG: hypothetical protein IT279_09045 [Ignavibacteriaceae bacterium]|nr:hypothetical protein [Ignavibacteriaceae bacterium]
MDKFNNVEFMRVYSDSAVKKAPPVVTWTGEQVNGLTKTQLAHKIAALLGKEGQTSISYKLTTGARWIVARIYAFNDPGKPTEKKTSAMDYTEIKKTFSDLYDMKAALLGEEITYLKSKIQLLTAENTDLKKQLEDEGGDPGGLVTLFTQLSSMTMNNARLKADHRSTPGEIPPDIQAVLSRIDYAKLTPEKIRELAAKLQQAISFFNLPIKQE